MTRRPLGILFSALAVASAVASASDIDADSQQSHVGSVPPKAHQLDASYTFKQYLKHFDKSYPDREEYDRRSAIFTRNLEKILRHNEGRLSPEGELLDGGYAMGVNAFTDVESDELPMGYNKLMHPAWRTQLVGAGVSKTERMLDGAQSYSQPPAFEMDAVKDLPENVNWTEKGKVNPTVPNQGGCGSCWAFAATAAIESHLSIETGDDPVSLSEQNILQCSPNPEQCGGQGGCTGSTVELALNYVADVTAKKTGGMFNIKEVPYHATYGAKTCDDVTENKTPEVGITGWTMLESNNYQATMNALAKKGPVAIAVAASGWGMYEKGVHDGGSDDATINHAVLLTGYGVDKDTGEKYWLVRNSWGSGFGESGYIRIKRSDDDDKNCKMDNNPLVGVACALDENGNKLDVKPAKICGTDGILFDVSYPQGAHKMES